MDVFQNIAGVLLTAVAVAAALVALVLDELKGRKALKAGILGFCGVVGVFGVYFSVRNLEFSTSQGSNQGGRTQDTPIQTHVAPPTTNWVTDTTTPIIATASSSIKQFSDANVLDTNYVVQANRLWQDTGIKLAVGDVVVFTSASGTWSVSPEGGEYSPTDANGFEKLSIKGLPFSGLIGKVDPAPSFFVGSEKAFTAYSDGPLMLRINDDSPEDNSGSISLRIIVIRKR